MQRLDAKEATTIANLVLTELLTVTTTVGTTGAALRTAVGDFQASALALIQADASGPPLTDIFQKAIAAGTTQPQFATLGDFAINLPVKLLGATLMKNALAEFALACQCAVITRTSFQSRNQVNALRPVLNAQFAPIEETVADQMDQMTFQAVVQLRAAISHYLVTTEQPLPRLLNFQFYGIMPTLVQAYKLYSDAGRADELRAENGVIHPAFAPRIGVALSQ
jgi:prophage DNA circulation protein